jgi:hypothetical protein
MKTVDFISVQAPGLLDPTLFPDRRFGIFTDRRLGIFKFSGDFLRSWIEQGVPFLPVFSRVLGDSTIEINMEPDNSTYENLDWIQVIMESPYLPEVKGLPEDYDVHNAHPFDESIPEYMVYVTVDRDNQPALINICSMNDDNEIVVQIDVQTQVRHSEVGEEV